MDTIRWGMIGCGDVAEVKSGPALQKAEGSALVAVMRRERAKAEDYARRHNVPRVHGEADALIHDPDVDAVYIATPPSSHCEPRAEGRGRGQALPGREADGDESRRVPSHGRGVPRRADAAMGRVLPARAAALPESARAAARERHRSADVGSRQSDRPARHRRRAKAWRFNTEISGAGLFLDLASHYFDIIDFLAGPITGGGGFAMNTGGSYAAEDVTATAFQIGDKVVVQACGTSTPRCLQTRSCLPDPVEKSRRPFAQTRM